LHSIYLITFVHQTADFQDMNSATSVIQRINCEVISLVSDIVPLIV